MDARDLTAVLTLQECVLQGRKKECMHIHTNIYAHTHTFTHTYIHTYIYMYAHAHYTYTQSIDIYLNSVKAMGH